MYYYRSAVNPRVALGAAKKMPDTGAKNAGAGVMAPVRVGATAQS